jgi:hypothetical protein
MGFTLILVIDGILVHKFCFVDNANLNWHFSCYAYIPSFDLAFLSVSILCVMLITVVSKIYAC